ncbi:MAG TPA: molybdopterin-dependent oxidoreductase [Gemmatimonadaceae bacterium]|nr:molybdopterin-dependent oxidoreductase [Gemmatimonadaceae bacterium]
MSAIDRRTFLRGMVVATAAGASTRPRVLVRDSATALPARARAVIWKKAPCRLCGVGCGLLIGIEGGRAVAVKGDPASPVSRGLACAKGYYSVQALYGRDRIRRASVRRGNGMSEAPIGEALDMVAAKIRETIAQHGKDSVAMYGSGQWSITDAYVAAKLFKGGLGTNNIETSARLYTAAAKAGLDTSFGRDAAIASYEDLDHADVFVVWDANIAETDPVLFSRMLERRRMDPAVRIVHVTTRTTRTSNAADHTMLHAPRTMLAVANGICHELLEQELVDRDFLAKRVAFRRGRTAVGHDVADALIQDEGVSATWDEYVAFLAAAPATRAAELSGIPVERIRWLATVYGDRTRRVMSVWGGEATRHSRGTWTSNALHNIHLLTGRIGRPGDTVLCLTGQPTGGNAVQEAGAAADALPRGVVTVAADRKGAARIWGVPEDRIDPRPGRSALALFRALDRGDIRFLWIQGTNPMLSLPNLDRYRRAAAKEGRFIVVSEAYPTPTTDVADVILPTAMWMEREGVFANVERRVQHFEQMIAPPGDAMSDTWQMIEVAKRLGLGTMFPADRRTHVAELWEEYRRFHDGSSNALPSYVELQARPGITWPVSSGKRSELADFSGHADRRAWIWLRPHEPPGESPSADYPFWLRTGAVLEHWGGGAMTRRVPSLHRSVPGAYVEISRDDARRLGIRNFERVRLVSPRASIEIEARIDYRSQPRPGEVFVPAFDEQVPINRLMSDAACPLSGQPDAVTCAVRIERLTGRVGA